MTLIFQVKSSKGKGNARRPPTAERKAKLKPEGKQRARESSKSESDFEHDLDIVRKLEVFLYIFMFCRLEIHWTRNCVFCSNPLLYHWHKFFSSNRQQSKTPRKPEPATITTNLDRQIRQLEEWAPSMKAVDDVVAAARGAAKKMARDIVDRDIDCCSTRFFHRIYIVFTKNSAQVYLL